MGKGVSPIPGFQVGAVFQGVMASLVILLVLTGILTVMTYYFSLPQEYFGLGGIIVGLAGAAGGGAYASKRASSMGLVHGLAVGLGLVVVSLVVGHWVLQEPLVLTDELRRLAVAVLVGGVGGIVGLNL